jgi:hypothetical protein
LLLLERYTLLLLKTSPLRLKFFQKTPHRPDVSYPISSGSATILVSGDLIENGFELVFEAAASLGIGVFQMNDEFIGGPSTFFQKISF